MKLDKSKRILIVGLGLIGGSYAQGLSRQGFEVGAIDKSDSSIAFALKKGYINHGQAKVTREYVEKFDIIVFALYPHVFIKWIEEYGGYIKCGAMITDVTGVKCAVVDKVQSMLKDGVEFIAAHPMAGREVYGVENANADIFCGANYIVTPTDRNSEQAVELCLELGRVLGFKRISCLSVSEHDEMIGFLSQLTHCIAVSLMTCKESEHLVDYTGDSFRDLTRIAKINENMWSELFMLNREELLAQMELFSEKFEFMKDCIKDGDTDSLKEMMRLSTKRRRYFDK